VLPSRRIGAIVAVDQARLIRRLSVLAVMLNELGKRGVQIVLASGELDSTSETARASSSRRADKFDRAEAAPKPVILGDGPLIADPFVGREHALAAIDIAIAGAAKGHGSVVLVAGEAGIGKTRGAGP